MVVTSVQAAFRLASSVARSKEVDGYQCLESVMKGTAVALGIPHQRHTVPVWQPKGGCGRRANANNFCLW